MEAIQIVVAIVLIIAIIYVVTKRGTPTTPTTPSSWTPITNATLVSAGGNHYVYYPTGSCPSSASPSNYAAGTSHDAAIDKCQADTTTNFFPCTGITQIQQVAPYGPIPIDEVKNPWAACYNVQPTGGQGAWELVTPTWRGTTKYSYSPNTSCPAVSTDKSICSNTDLDAVMNLCQNTTGCTGAVELNTLGKQFDVPQTSVNGTDSLSWALCMTQPVATPNSGVGMMELETPGSGSMISTISNGCSRDANGPCNDKGFACGGLIPTGGGGFD